MPQMPFGKSPLFRTLPAEARNTIRKKFRESAMGKIQAEVEKLGARASGEDVRRVIDRYSRKLKPEAMFRQLLGSDTYRMAKEIERYASGQGLSRRLLGSLLSSLGPAGKMIGAIIGPGQGKSLLQRELQIASDLLRAYGRLVIEPGQVDQAEAIAEHLRGLGYTVLPPGQQRPAGTRPPATRVEDVAPAQRPKTTTVRLGTSDRKFPADHPIVSGEMVLTPNSTNVHSFGYDLENTYLYVRFLDSQGDGVRSGPGALYRYAGVMPHEFLSLYRTRNGGNGQGGDSTPGTWLWSHIRIRGTLSGHRKDYELVGVVRNYVPRKATLVPEGEAFIRRTVRSLEGKTIKSALRSQLVRPLAPVKVRGAR